MALEASWGQKGKSRKKRENKGHILKKTMTTPWTRKKGYMEERGRGMEEPGEREPRGMEERRRWKGGTELVV
jgi:hypothetical protein